MDTKTTIKDRPSAQLRDRLRRVLEWDAVLGVRLGLALDRWYKYGERTPGLERTIQGIRDQRDTLCETITGLKALLRRAIVRERKAAQSTRQLCGNEGGVAHA